MGGRNDVKRDERETRTRIEGQQEGPVKTKRGVYACTDRAFHDRYREEKRAG